MKVIILPEQKEATLDIDAQIDFKDISKKVLPRFETFCTFLAHQIQNPDFITKGVFDYGTSKVVGREQEHIIKSIPRLFASLISSIALIPQSRIIISLNIVFISIVNTFLTHSVAFFIAIGNVIFYI